jgi:hypothetical protein
MVKELRLLKDVYSVRLFGNRIIVSFMNLKAAERALTAGQIQAGEFSLRVISRTRLNKKLEIALQGRRGKND